MMRYSLYFDAALNLSGCVNTVSTSGSLLSLKYSSELSKSDFVCLSRVVDLQVGYSGEVEPAVRKLTMGSPHAGGLLRGGGDTVLLQVSGCRQRRIFASGHNAA